MVNWQPGASLATLRQRAKLLSTVRKFFTDRDILEILSSNQEGFFIPFTKEVVPIINIIDGFILATPAHTHYSLAKEVITNHKPILVEKPFTLNLKVSTKSLSDKLL